MKITFEVIGNIFIVKILTILGETCQECKQMINLKNMNYLAKNKPSEIFCLRFLKRILKQETM